jgi:flagella basal body P-ring formation protein FlgA
MIANLPPLACRRAHAIRPMMMLRITLAAVAVCLAIAPAFAAERAVLRSEIRAAGDTLMLADLVEGADTALAETPLFRAPALGETGTIQVRRIVEAISRLGIDLDTRGKAQVLITRPARRIATAEIEAAVKGTLEQQLGIDARALSVVFDGTSPTLLVPASVHLPVVADDLAYDRRSRRVAATVWVGSNAGERRAAMRVAGAVSEFVDVAVLNRALARGETVQTADLSLERRPKDMLPADLPPDGPALAGRVARRALGPGAVLRSGDLAKPEIVARGEIVTVFYEIPGMTLTLRGKASEAGSLGDAIAVVNPQSKKTLQATVIGPGKVAVTAAPIGRVALHTAQP